MRKQDHGRSRSGKLIDDELLQELSKQAEDGFDVDEILRRRGGRPPMGSAAASVESVRLDPSSVRPFMIEPITKGARTPT